MKRTLVVKLTICFALLAVGMLTLVNTLGYNIIKDSIIEEKKNALYSEAVLISSEYMENYSNKEVSLLALNSHLRAVDTFIDAHIWIINSYGTIICDTSSNSLNIVGKNINTYDNNFLNNLFLPNTTITGLIETPSLFVIYPIPYNYSLRNYVVIYLDNEIIEEECISFTNTWTIFTLVFLGLLFLLFFYIYLMTVRPLHKIRNAALQYANGNFNYKLSLRGNDEFHEVASALNYMSLEIRNFDEYQKKFVANISHDFRSPLTSIKGYAEAILDGTIPKELQNKYLDIIAFESERLNKLTNNLLELNSFDHNKNLLEITNFDINQIIKKIINTFEGICTKKKIQCVLVFSDEEMYVTADMGKIQQVLYNLIDNAIKFSHTNSSIRISTTEKGDKVFISVKDFGDGIPKASIHKIWERFYKLDSSRGKDKKGTGLGLSITKEIITAHKENIDVISTEGVGSEFTFSLSKSEQ